jgi:indolepyruvate ferredoxin oxidoreductase
VNYHLAPPVFGGKTDSRGRPRKHQFGVWMKPVLALLAKGKGLRASALNPFGYHSEARLHRDLLAWYEDLLDQAGRDGASNPSLWAEILSAPMDIRGYGPVRAQAAQEVKAKVARLLG